MSPPVPPSLVALRSGRALFIEDLRGLSDLDTRDAADLARAWPDLPRERRLEIIRRAGELAGERIELNFDRLSLIAVRDPDPTVRIAAITNLWESEEPSVLRTLLTVLETDPDPTVQTASARSLGRFVYECEVDGKHPALKGHLERALLAAAAGEPDLGWEALAALGYSARAEVPPLIEAAYGHPDPSARQAAIIAMGRSGDRRWKANVIAELRSPSPSMRGEAARAAGELELRGSVGELTELLDDSQIEVQRTAIWALGQIGGKPAQRALERFRKATDDEDLARAADEALEYLVFVDGIRDLEAGLRAQEEPD